MKVKIPKTNFGREYDRIVWTTIQNIISRSKTETGFYIKHFDIENNEHKFFIFSCLALQGIYDTKTNTIKRIYVRENWWTRHKINHLIGSKQYRVLKLRKIFLSRAMDIDEILNFERPYAEKITYPNFSFGDIYEEFFSREEHI